MRGGVWFVWLSLDCIVPGLNCSGLPYLSVEDCGLVGVLVTGPDDLVSGLAAGLVCVAASGLV